MADEEFKYKINEYLEKLPQGLSVADFVFLLNLDFSINLMAFDYDRSLKITEADEIPDDRLKVYAFMLHVEKEDLIN